MVAQLVEYLPRTQCYRWFECHPRQLCSSIINECWTHVFTNDIHYWKNRGAPLVRSPWNEDTLIIKTPYAVSMPVGECILCTVCGSENRCFLCDIFWPHNYEFSPHSQFQICNPHCVSQPNLVPELSIILRFVYHVHVYTWKSFTPQSLYLMWTSYFLCSVNMHVCVMMYRKQQLVKNICLQERC